MTTLFQDPVIGQPDASSVLQTPGPSAPGLGISSPNVAQDAMQARVKSMPVDQRIFSGLGEVGAALKGDPSPMSVQDQQQQTLKMNNFKLLNETMGALQQGLTLIQGTSGEDRKRLATAYASKLDSTEPGMGQVFSALSDKPGMLDMLKQNAHLLPQSWQMEIVSDPQSALKRLGTPEGQATFNAAMEVPQIDNATQKGMFLLGHWQQLVSPELAKEIGNPTNLSTGDLVKINNAVKENPQYAKLAIPDDALRVALTHDAFASSLHLMDPKGVQDVMKKRSESGTWSAPYELNGAQVQKNDATGEIRTAVSRVPVTNVTIDGGKVPAGYKKSADGNSLEYIPGGPADPNAQHGAIGAREAVFLNRTLVGANEAAKDLSNIVQGPISQSTGFFGGRGQAPGLMNAGQEALTNQMTSQEVQSYNVMSAGFQRSLAAIESAGLAPNGLLSHQMDAVAFKEGDTNLTKLQKLAQTRQIIEAGLESTLSNPRVPEEQKKHIQNVIGEVQKAVPFTHTDILKMQNAQAINPNATLKSVMNTVTSGGSAMPDVSAIDAEIARRKSAK